jgi:hypothetical protein
VAITVLENLLLSDMGKIVFLPLSFACLTLTAMAQTGAKPGRDTTRYRPYSASIQYINKPDHDTSYYRSFKGSIITRVFFSRNYSEIKLDPTSDFPKMIFHANTPLSIGVGITYRFLSISVSKGLNFLQSNTNKGKTSSFNLQLHLYKKKWTFDALTQFYKGYYLGQPNLESPNGQTHYLRPDMGLQTVGLAAYRVLNDQRFTYGAGLSQNALQLKSAGSFLIGGQAFYTSLHADSTLAPYNVDSLYGKQNIRKVHLFEIGPGIGYAYTFVWQRHYFLLGSVNANLNAAFSREIGESIRRDQVSVSANYLLRFGTGYNTAKWGLSAIWLTSSINAQGESSGFKYTMAVGSYRLVYVRRIAINRHMQKILAPIN